VFVTCLIFLVSCAPGPSTSPNSTAVNSSPPATTPGGDEQNLTIQSFTASPATGSVPLTTVFSWVLSPGRSTGVSCTLDVDSNGVVDYEIADCLTTNQLRHSYVQGGDWVPLFKVKDSSGYATSFAGSVFVVDNAVTYTVTLAGGNHSPPIDSSGTGVVIVSIESNILTLAGNFEGLIGNSTASHIHIGAIGENGPIEIPINLTVDEVDKHRGSLSLVHTLSEDQAALLQVGKLYINVHSESFPSGELRGQLIKP
jgi:CHRD domain